MSITTAARRVALSDDTATIYAVCSPDHALARRKQTFGLVEDYCRCGVYALGNVESDPEPIRAHFMIALGHVVEYVRIGPNVLEDGCDAVGIGCVCGWTADMLGNLAEARELHAVHAEHPMTLTPAVTRPAY